MLEVHLQSDIAVNVDQEICVRVAGSIIEFFHGNERVASHRLDDRKRQKNTVEAHMKLLLLFLFVLQSEMTKECDISGLDRIAGLIKGEGSQFALVLGNGEKQEL